MAGSAKLPPRLISKKFESFVGTKRSIKDKAAKDAPRISPWIIYGILGIVVFGFFVNIASMKSLF